MAQSEAPESASWRYVDINFGNYKVLSVLQHVSKDLHDLAADVNNRAIQSKNVKDKIVEFCHSKPEYLTSTQQLIHDPNFTIAKQRQAILNDIIAARKEISKIIVNEAVKYSTSVALTQFIALWDVWKELNDHKFFFKNSNQLAIEIEIELTKTRENCQEVKRQVNAYIMKQLNTQIVDKRLLKQIQQLTQQIRSSYFDMAKKLDDLWVNIDGKMLNLKFHKFALSDAVIKDALRVSAASRGLSLRNPLANIDALATTSVASFSGLLNLWFGGKTSKALKQLQIVVQKMNHLEAVSRDINLIRQQAEKFLVKNKIKLDWLEPPQSHLQIPISKELVITDSHGVNLNLRISNWKPFSRFG